MSEKERNILENNNLPKAREKLKKEIDTQTRLENLNKIFHNLSIVYTGNSYFEQVLDKRFYHFLVKQEKEVFSFKKYQIV